jgi:hypothetical protein
MSTVLYLANQQIQVVTGSPGEKKVTVQNAYTADAPEGSIINGIIMDAELFVEFIKEFWQTNRLSSKDVILVIKSSKFVGKTIELPVLNASKTIEYIEREFSDIRKEENEIYGYIPLASSDKSMRRIYAEGVSPEFIKEYIEIFQEAGISVKSVYSGESSLISLTNMTMAAWYKTFVMLIADNTTLTTLLWVNGSFYHFNSVRCFHEQGTEEYAMDVARSVTQIVQFMQAHQVEYSLEAIRLAGIPDVNIRQYEIAMNSQGINVPIEPFESSVLSADSADVQSYLNATSGLVINGKWQNFLNQYNSKKRKKGNEKNSMKGVLIVGITLAVMILAVIICFVMRIIKQNQLNQIEDEIYNPIVLEEIAEYDALMERNTFLINQYNGIQEFDENIVTYPICDNEVIQLIDTCASNYVTVQFGSFDADSGRVILTAEAENVDDINKFIRELNSQDIFQKVDYTGYSYDTTAKLWDINVTCTLTEAAGR